MEYLQLLTDKDGSAKRAYAILRKYYATWNRRTGSTFRPGVVKVKPEDPFRLRAEVIKALLAK